MTPLRLFFLSGFVSLAAVTANAQVTINFDSLTLENYDPIPANYGLGLDPHISNVAYRTFVQSTGATLTPYVEFWNNSYGDLSKVAFASQNGAIAEIAFTPQAGYAVHLISFDMAGYPQADLSNSYMRLVDSSNNVILDFASQGAVAIQGNNSGLPHSSFTPDLTFTGTLRLQWGTNWNVGLDNIRFEAIAVPEPSTLVLLGAGALGLVAQGWRRRRSTR